MAPARYSRTVANITTVSRKNFRPRKKKKKEAKKLPFKPEEREYSKVIYDHNLFYQPSTYLYGVIGIRFYSNDDSFYFTNNTVISTYAQHSLMPGNSGWFTGLTACENLTAEQIEQTAETVTDVIIKYNRICGPYKPVDKQNVKYNTCWDYSYN